MELPNIEAMRRLDGGVEVKFGDGTRLEMVEEDGRIVERIFVTGEDAAYRAATVAEQRDHSVYEGIVVALEAYARTDDFEDLREVWTNLAEAMETTRMKDAARR